MIIDTRRSARIPTGLVVDGGSIGVRNLGKIYDDTNWPNDRAAFGAIEHVETNGSPQLASQEVSAGVRLYVYFFEWTLTSNAPQTRN